MTKKLFLRRSCQREDSSENNITSCQAQGVTAKGKEITTNRQMLSLHRIEREKGSEFKKIATTALIGLRLKIRHFVSSVRHFVPFEPLPHLER